MIIYIYNLFVGVVIIFSTRFSIFLFFFFSKKIDCGSNLKFVRLSKVILVKVKHSIFV